MRVQISIKISLHTSFKPVKCNQADNINLKNSQKQTNKQTNKKQKQKNPFLEYWELGAEYFYTVKHFSTLQKLGAGDGGQPNNFSFGLRLIQ